MAASTCSHTSRSWQTAPMSATGSIAIDDVVPTVATTMHGTNPAARSASMAAASASGRIA